MGKRVRRAQDNVPQGEPERVGGVDDTTVETTFDGQTFAWGPGQTRNFADDAVGLGHATFLGAASLVRADGLHATDGNPDF